MKKIIPLSAISLILLSGCIWPAVDGAPVYGVPYDRPLAEQPKYSYDKYNEYKESAIERTSLDVDVAEYNQNSSFKMQEALRKSIVDVKSKYPSIFAQHKIFLVGALVNVNDINKSEKAGRVSAMGLVDAIGKTATAKYIRYKRDMIIVHNGMIAPTAEATKAAIAFKADALVMGVYKVTSDNIVLRYAFYDAKTRAYLGEQTTVIPLDRQTSKFALDI